jgi:hypothetical protein
MGPPELHSSGYATSSAPFKVRELSYDSLPEPDKLKLKAVVQEAVPILVIMVQCLYELDLKFQIVPFLQLLCGSKHEEYPFELAYLVINLFVSMKEVEKARKVSETVLSSLRSQLGPVPIKIPGPRIISSSYHGSDAVTQDVSPSSPAKASSSSSSDSQASMAGLSADDDSYDLDEDEATIIKRQHFESLLQLYIFHILCPLHLFADAKSYLFIEARVHPKLIQQWIYYVDELEGAHLEENKRQEDMKRSQQISNDARDATAPSRRMDPKNSFETPRLSSHSWWDRLLSDEPEPEELDNLLPLGSSLSTHPQITSKPFYYAALKHIIKFLRNIAARYQKLPEAAKIALKVLLVLASMALTYAISTSKWLRSLQFPPWTSSKQKMRKLAAAHSSQASSSSSIDPRALTSRIVLGSAVSPRYR